MNHWTVNVLVLDSERKPYQVSRTPEAETPDEALRLTLDLLAQPLRNLKIITIHPAGTISNHKSETPVSCAGCSLT